MRNPSRHWICAALLATSFACDPKVMVTGGPGPGYGYGGGKADAGVDPERAPDAAALSPGPGPILPPATDSGTEAGATGPTSSACPGGDAPAPASCASLGVVVAAAYAPHYTCFDLGPVPGLPMNKYGGLTLTETTGPCSDTLIIGGDANLPTGKLYSIKVRRDPGGHISGFAGTAAVFADAPYNDGGVSFGPGGVIFATRWPSNELQQTRPGTAAVAKATPLDSLGVPHASASLGFVPSNLPGGGGFKLMSWPGGQWHTLAIAADGAGTYDVTMATRGLTLPGGPRASSTWPPAARSSARIRCWSRNGPPTRSRPTRSIRAAIPFWPRARIS